MKRFLAFLCAAFMLCTLTACGCSAAPAENSGPAMQNTVPGSGETAAVPTQPAFQEQTVVDNELCTVRITGIEPDNLWGYSLNAYLENKSQDTTYMYSVTTASVNGVQTEPFFAVEVAPGKKAKETITLTDPSPSGAEIGEFTDIELNFRVYDTNDWNADPVAKSGVHIYPKGEENVVRFSRAALPTDNVIVDNESVSVTVTGYREDNIWGYTADLFLVNKTESPLMFSVEDASVNGYMADPYYATSVGAGKCAFSAISWSDTAFEENGIPQVESIEFLLRAYREDDWNAEDVLRETITLNP